jgi:hypothetical protein
VEAEDTQMRVKTTLGCELNLTKNRQSDSLNKSQLTLSHRVDAHALRL